LNQGICMSTAISTNDANASLLVAKKLSTFHLTALISAQSNHPLVGWKVWLNVMRCFMRICASLIMMMPKSRQSHVCMSMSSVSRLNLHIHGSVNVITFEKPCRMFNVCSRTAHTILPTRHPK
jgi:hypothetical protein